MPFPRGQFRTGCSSLGAEGDTSTVGALGRISRGFSEGATRVWSRVSRVESQRNLAELLRARSGGAAVWGSAAARGCPATAVGESRRGGVVGNQWGEMSKSWAKYSGCRVCMSTIVFGRFEAGTTNDTNCTNEDAGGIRVIRAIRGLTSPFQLATHVACGSNKFNFYATESLPTGGGFAMKSLDASDLRQQIADALNTVAYGGERIAIKRHGKRIAVLVPVDDLELLEAMEDRVDLALAKKALKEKGRIPWERAKRELGL